MAKKSNKDRMLDFLKGCDGAKLAKLAKDMGWDDEAEEEVELEDDGSEEEDDGMDKSMSAAQLRKGMSRVARGLQRPTTARPDPYKGIESHADAAVAGDATGLVKSLARGAADAYAGVGAALDDLAAQVEAIANVGLAAGHTTLRLEKSISEISARLDGLMKGLSAPVAPRAVTARPVERFRGDAQPAAAAPTGLSKSQARGLIERALRKAADAGDQQYVEELTQDMINLETGGFLPPDRLAAIRS